jgi:hypothetical protein
LALVEQARENKEETASLPVSVSSSSVLKLAREPLGAGCRNLRPVVTTEGDLRCSGALEAESEPLRPASLALVVEGERERIGEGLREGGVGETHAARLGEA